MLKVNKISAATQALLIAAGVSSFIAVAIASPALDKSYSNQDNLVQETKWRNAGYFDDKNGIEISKSEFSDFNKQANDFLSKNRESLNNQKSNKD